MTALPCFSRQEWLFSLKSFAGAMLALYLSSRFGLPRPFWSMMTAYIVAHPLAGHVRSKSLYRLGGTVLGCAAAVVLVPSLSASPVLLSLALALWVGMCLYLSLLDRSARSYAFMLGGYSAALIGFPLVDAPAAMFDTAIARAEEIGLGIVCASLVHSIVWPAGLAPSLLGLIDRALGDVRRWAGDLLGSGVDAEARERLAQDRRRLAVDITQLRLSATHVPFDTGNLRWTQGAVRDLLDRLAALTPSLSALEDRLEALREATGSVPDDIARAMTRSAACLDADAPRASDDVRIAFHAHAADPRNASWVRALHIDMAVHFDALVAGWRRCRALRADIAAGLAGHALPLRRRAVPRPPVLHVDKGLAMRSAFTVVLSTCAACAAWILSGWRSGSSMAMAAAVFCSFFATLDDPVPGMHKFLVALLWSLPVSAFYVLGVMPLAQDFVMLMLCIAPLFLVVGGYLARPASSLTALGMFFGVAGTLALHDVGSADWVGFLEGQLAIIAGALIAGRMTSIVRSVSSEWSAQRIRSATWRDLAEMTTRPASARSYGASAGRMLDRIALLVPRTAGAAGAQGSTAAGLALRELRIGASISVLQRHRHLLPDALSRHLLADLRRSFLARAKGFPPRHEALLPQIDRLLVLSLASTACKPAVTALVGLRRDLFPSAPTDLQP
ncbi:putative membrane protein YccC [Variovorax sp. TBS-050B]|uniref:FUSC family protein n=1 Tax=Variovorax sp. TBS-050B TaxID=2940551 RepID=UPI002473FB39|nr:FUSC family protein [Variovorax sp. TBS-050B]MDH6590124.1 putative membrane protein YccC [Variovorax sp. TBS-050B]